VSARLGDEFTGTFGPETIERFVADSMEQLLPTAKINTEPLPNDPGSRHAPSVPVSTEVELTTTRFRALGDPTRLRVVQELAHGTRCVCELRAQIGVSGPLLSHHLNVLRDAGLVTASRRGRWVDYRLDTDALASTLATVTPDLAGAVR